MHLFCKRRPEWMRNSQRQEIFLIRCSSLSFPTLSQSREDPWKDVYYMKLSHTHKMCVLSSIVPRPLMLPTPSLLLPDLPALGLEQPSRYRRSTNQDLVSSSEDSAQSSPTCHTSANILRSLVFKISKNENDGFPRERNHLPVFEIVDLTLWHVYVKLDEHAVMIFTTWIKMEQNSNPNSSTKAAWGNARKDLSDHWILPVQVCNVFKIWQCSNMK